MKRTVLCLPVLLCLLVTAVARAQTPAPAPAVNAAEEGVRTQLISEAQAAHKAGDHKKALDLANRAAAIQMTPSLRWFLAFEQDEVGQVAEALGNAQQCTREFERDPSLPKRDEYLPLCKSLRERLEKRVGHLVLKVEQIPEGLTVKIGGRPINQALIGVRYPVTPGPVAVEATAPGHSPFRTEITVSAGPEVEVTLTLSPAPMESRTCPVGFVRQGNDCVLGSPPAAREPMAAALTDSAQPKAGGARKLGLSLGIAGAAIAVASGITWGIAHSKFTSLRDKCDRNECTDEEASSGKDTIRTLDRLSVAGALAGGALLVTGSAIFFAGRW